MKVIDKRMFTPDGELREEYRDSPAVEAPVTTAGQVAAVGSPATSGAVRSESESDSMPPPPAGGDEAAATAGRPGESRPQAPAAAGFLDLVDLLAQPILLYLGDLALPDGKKAENLPLARLHIDLLDVLKDKTQGNLLQQEQAVIDDLLYRLRLRYVQKTT